MYECARQTMRRTRQHCCFVLQLTAAICVSLSVSQSGTGVDCPLGEFFDSSNSSCVESCPCGFAGTVSGLCQNFANSSIYFSAQSYKSIVPVNATSGLVLASGELFIGHSIAPLSARTVDSAHVSIHIDDGGQSLKLLSQTIAFSYISHLESAEASLFSTDNSLLITTGLQDSDYSCLSDGMKYKAVPFSVVLMSDVATLGIYTWSLSAVVQVTHYSSMASSALKMEINAADCSELYAFDTGECTMQCSCGTTRFPTFCYVFQRGSILEGVVNASIPQNYGTNMYIASNFLLLRASTLSDMKQLSIRFRQTKNPDSVTYITLSMANYGFILTGIGETSVHINKRDLERIATDQTLPNCTASSGMVIRIPFEVHSHQRFVSIGEYRFNVTVEMIDVSTTTETNPGLLIITVTSASVYPHLTSYQLPKSMHTLNSVTLESSAEVPGFTTSLVAAIQKPIINEPHQTPMVTAIPTNRPTSALTKSAEMRSTGVSVQTSVKPSPKPPILEVDISLVFSLIASGGALACTPVVFLICTCMCIALRRKSKKQKQKEIELERLYNRSSLSENPYAQSELQRKVSVQSLKQELVENISTELTIDSQQLRLMDCIGEGEFGLVYSAHWFPSKVRSNKPVVVAVKTLKGIFDANDVNDLVKESLQMRSFSHSNVMGLLGICLNAGPAPYIVLPFMSGGSLLAHLKTNREEFVIKSDEYKEQVETQLLSMCLQIAKGMEYLAAQKFIHRDLAARNCMIDGKGVIKVSDFGLTRNSYEKLYVRQDKSQGIKLPIKWLAIESLNDGVFSEKTDVWSYGVTCWEVFSGGKVPYAGISSMDLPQLIENGHRMAKPSNAACSQNSYSTLMLSCWLTDADERPKFSQLVTEINNYLSSVAGYLDLSQVNKRLPSISEDDTENEVAYLSHI